jgi:hypothetical protein
VRKSRFKKKQEQIVKPNQLSGMPRRQSIPLACKANFCCQNLSLQGPGRKFSSDGVRRTTETLTKNEASLLVSGDHVGFQKRSATCRLKQGCRGAETGRLDSRILGGEGKIGGKLEGLVGTEIRHENLQNGMPTILLQE